MRSLRPAVILLAGVAALCGGEAAAQSALKPALRGLVSMGNIAFHRQDGGIPDNSLAALLARPGIFAGAVVNVTWAELEPVPGTLDTGAIDRPVAAVRAYNAKYRATPLAVHLRVWGGPNAPDWAKHLGGAPVSVLHLDIPITIGRFWTAAYRDAWRSLQERLARKYDSEPLIREVSNTSCASITDEPFLLPADPLSLQHLIEAGFDSAAQRDCLAQSAKDYALWRTTRIDYYFNPFRGIVAGRPQVEPEVALAIMRQWRQQLGPRGILSNHALSSPPSPHLVGLYDAMHALGPPIEFQTHAPRGLDWDATIRYAVSLGAASVELWPDTHFGGFTQIPPDQLKEWAAELERN